MKQLSSLLPACLRIKTYRVIALFFALFVALPPNYFERTNRRRIAL